MSRLALITRTYAESSCGKLRRAEAPTSQLLLRLCASPRTACPSRAHSSWESASQLPWLQHARPLTGSRIQVGNAAGVSGLLNSILSSKHNALMPARSCGGECHPLRGWGRTPQAGSPTPTPRGFALPRLALHSLHDTRPVRSTIMSPCTSPMPNGDLHPIPTISTSSGGAVLALDLGTTTGWALRTPEGLITSGIARFRPGRYDGGGMRYLRFANWLTEIDRL